MNGLTTDHRCEKLRPILVDRSDQPINRCVTVRREGQRSNHVLSCLQGLYLPPQ
jgi:hypothetical protein